MNTEKGHIGGERADWDRLVEEEGGAGRVKLNGGCTKKPYANLLFCKLI